jgi:hypothetical protein
MNYEKIKEKTEKETIPLSHVGARGGNPPLQKKKDPIPFSFLFLIYMREV